MHTLLVQYSTPENPEEFRRYYTTTHLALASKMPGLKAWRYSLDVMSEDDDPIFAVFEADFANRDDMLAALASKEGAATQADVANFATGGVRLADFTPHSSSDNRQ